MRCPRCNHSWKPRGQVKGGRLGRRKAGARCSIHGLFVDDQGKCSYCRNGRRARIKPNPYRKYEGWAAVRDRSRYPGYRGELVWHRVRAASGSDGQALACCDNRLCLDVDSFTETVPESGKACVKCFRR